MSKIDYIITDITGAHFPGVLPYRGPSSRRGYRTREEAETRAREVDAHYAARTGRGLDLRVMPRGSDDWTEVNRRWSADRDVAK
jgi:hypothetical protein